MRKAVQLADLQVELPGLGPLDCAPVDFGELAEFVLCQISRQPGFAYTPPNPLAGFEDPRRRNWLHNINALPS